jgi:PmbA protein
MLNTINKFLRYGKRKTDFIEINVSESDNSEILIEKNNIKSFSFKNIQNVFIRVWIKGQKGISNGNILTKQLIDDAVKNAKNSQKQEFFYGLPKKQKYSEVEGLFSNEFEDINGLNERLVGLSKVFLKQFKDKDVYVPTASLSSSKSKVYLINSQGAEAEDKFSFMAFSAESFPKNKKGMTIYDSIESRKALSLEQVDDFGKNLRKETELFLNARKLKDFKVPQNLILKDYALFEILENAFLSNFNSENLLKGRSVFQGKKGEKLFSEKLSLQDKGLLKGGIGSRSFDDEGTRVENTCLVKKGILKNFIYDYNMAKHFKKESRGNAYSDGIGFNNVFIEPSKKAVEEQVDKALIVKVVLGSHTANPFTTSFSVSPVISYYLDKGKKIPVKDFLLSGNFLEMLKDSDIGKEIINKSNFYCPAIIFKDFGIHVF